MPLLGMDENGNVFQFDHDSHEPTQMGRAPFRSQDDNMFKFENEDPKVLKDRIAFENIKKINQEIAYRKWAENQRHKRFLNVKLQKQLVARQAIAQKIAGIKRTRQNLRLMQALSQKGQNYERLSGVGGYGLSEDGRKPYMDRPTIDWRKFENTYEAFGQDPYLRPILKSELKRNKGSIEEKIKCIEKKCVNKLNELEYQMKKILKGHNKIIAALETLEARREQNQTPYCPQHPLFRFIPTNKLPEIKEKLNFNEIKSVLDHE